MPKDLEKVLVIDDNEDILLALKLLLKKHAKAVIIEKNPKKIPFLLNNDTYDAILLDMNFSQDTDSGREGFYWLERIMEMNPLANVIMITAYGDVETAVRSLKEGAADFVLKPWQNDKLVETIKKSVAQHKERTSSSSGGKTAERRSSSSGKKSKGDNNDDPFSAIIGNSEPMQNIFTIIRKVAATDANVLILGENGTGKELFAQAIHKCSPRRSNAFVSVDMGSITKTLFESELFGHKKGAFTDAKEDRAGRFETASGGTLFLDEIGNIPMSLQAKLLTALQQRKITRVGSNKPVDIDIRLVCATNMPLYDMVHENEFRQDLVYRINTVEIKLPALRDREDDIPLLAKHFTDTYCDKYNQEKKTLSQAAMKKLRKYHWPGNIRELQHAIERAVIMSEDRELTPGDFLFLLEKSEAGEMQIEDYNLENIEKLVIQKAISKHSGNISKAAKALGLTRASLYRRLEKHGL